MKTRKWPDRIWIVRHARSLGQDLRGAAEKSGALSFDLGMEEKQVPLVKRGWRQAAARGRWFGKIPKNQQPTVVLVSPFVRTRQTARAIAQASGIPPERLRIVVEPRLRELRHGRLNCITRKGFRERFPEEVEKLRRLGELSYRQPDGENRWDVVKRLRSLIDDLSTVYRNERVLIVTHSGVIRCLRYLLQNMTEAEFLEAVRNGDAANCSVTSYVRDRSSGELVPDAVPYLGNPLDGQRPPRRRVS